MEELEKMKKNLGDVIQLVSLVLIGGLIGIASAIMYPWQVQGYFGWIIFLLAWLICDIKMARWQE